MLKKRKHVHFFEVSERLVVAAVHRILVESEGSAVKVEDVFDVGITNFDSLSY